jgi:transcriptional regulator
MGETKKATAVGDMLPGTLDMLILKALSRGEAHGYTIVQFIHGASRDVLKVEEGALYPALHRLEVRGLLRAEWGTSENNRRAKYYRLTPRGRKQLAVETSKWDTLARAIARVLRPA